MSEVKVEFFSSDFLSRRKFGKGLKTWHIVVAIRVYSFFKKRGVPLTRIAEGSSSSGSSSFSDVDQPQSKG
jgi:hypothetical protein